VIGYELIVQQSFYLSQTAPASDSSCCRALSVGQALRLSQREVEHAAGSIARLLMLDN